MKRGGLVLFAALVAGIGTFCGLRWQRGMAQGQHSGIALDSMPELAWLQRELGLSEAQLITVRALHLAYRPKCVEMCRRIAVAHEKIEAMAPATRVISPEFHAALREHADLHVECQESMLRHLYETAATLNPGQAERYLKSMLPFALDFSHSEPGNLHIPWYGGATIHGSHGCGVDEPPCRGQ